MKKLLLLVATAAGALFVQRKIKEQQAEQNLWHEATATPAVAQQPSGD